METTHVFDVCISIVSGNNKEMSWDCVKSVLQSLTGELDAIIIFVDNASPADWFQELPNISPLIRVLRNESKLGFGANHNLVMKQVPAKFYFVLNDDTLVDKEVCERLIEEAKKFEKVGFLGPKILNQDLSLQRSCYRFPSPYLMFIQSTLLTRFFPKFFDDYSVFDHNTTRFVDFVIGAAMLVNSEMVSQIGMLDENFFMYSEEIDWCRRGNMAGWRTLFAPVSNVIHFGGQSTIEIPKERAIEFFRSHTLYLKKHFNPTQRIVYRIGCVIKHFPRWFFFSFISINRGKAKEHETSLLWAIGRLKGKGLRERTVASTQI